MRQGRTDAWIAHQLDVTVQQIEAFKRENDLDPTARPSRPPARLRRRGRPACRGRRADRRRARGRGRGGSRRGRGEERRGDGDADDDDEGEDDAPRPRAAVAAAAAAGAPRRGAARPLEGTFDHGEEGYGLWLDPAIQDDPIYAEHWAGHRPVEVTIEEDQIVIRRAGGDEDEDEDERASEDDE